MVNTRTNLPTIYRDFVGKLKSPTNFTSLDRTIKLLKLSY